MDDTLKKGQENAAKKRRVRNITLLQAVGDGFKVVGTENQGIRTPADIAKWMEEKNYIGTVYPCRMQRPVTRAEQKTFKVTIG